MIYLEFDDLLHVAERTLSGQLAVRDIGLLESALGRPRATAFGSDAYPDLDHKTAALLHSLASNHALVDGNKRLALAATVAFYGLNGRRLDLSNDDAHDLVLAVAAGELNDVREIADRLATVAARWYLFRAPTGLRRPDEGSLEKQLVRRGTKP